MQLILDSKMPLISLGFWETIKARFPMISFTWDSVFTVDSENETLFLICYDGDIREVRNRIRSIKSTTAPIIVLLLVSGNVSVLPALVSDGVTGFIDVRSDEKEVWNALTKVLSRQNYYCEPVWNEILNSSDGTAVSRYGLTKREIEILKELLTGKTTGEVSRLFGLSTHTVQTHRKNSFRKLQVRSMSELILFELKHRVFKIPFDKIPSER